MALLEIEQLQIHYGRECAVRGADLEVDDGDLMALVGPSGCGKTSLLRAVAGFEVPTAGTIRVAGETLVGPGRFVPPERRKIGMVFQQGALFPHLTAWRNVLYGLGGKGSDAEARGRAALELVGMERHRDRYPDELSGGEQQRVALARAIAPRPRLILLDEPFASLDAPLRRRLREDLRLILEEARITALMVTHDQEEALSIADRVTVMSDGEVLQSGDPISLYRHPGSLKTARIVGDAQLIRGRAAAGKARTVFGEVDCGGEIAPGPCRVLVRPEDLELVALDEPQGESGTVIREHFFGHDLLEEVELEDGTRIKVRVFSSDHAAPGDRVRVALRRRDLPVFSSEPS